MAAELLASDHTRTWWRSAATCWTTFSRRTLVSPSDDHTRITARKAPRGEGLSKVGPLQNLKSKKPEPLPERTSGHVNVAEEEARQPLWVGSKDEALAFDVEVAVKDEPVEESGPASSSSAGFAPPMSDSFSSARLRLMPKPKVSLRMHQPRFARPLPSDVCCGSGGRCVWPGAGVFSSSVSPALPRLGRRFLNSVVRSFLCETRSFLKADVVC